MDSASSRQVTDEDLDIAAPPEVFLCPISREIMRDPVVLVESGQIYDKASIHEWFQRGRNTCPLTGKQLTSQRLTQLHALRTAIEDWATHNGIELDPISIPSAAPGDSSTATGPMDDPSFCLSVIASKGISIYDIKGLSQMVAERKVPDAYAALVIFRDMVKHGDTEQQKGLRRVLDVDLLRSLLWEDRLQVPAARLLVHMRGVLDVDELLSLLVLQDVELQVDVLTRLIEHICEKRGHVQEAAGAVGRWISAVCRRFRGRRRQRSNHRRSL